MSTRQCFPIGHRMPDGTIYAGLSPDTNEPMFALPADAPLMMHWQQAMDYAANFEGHGHPKGTFRVPTKDELNFLFKHKAKIGGFKEIGPYPTVWYWSSSDDNDDPDYAWVQRFAGGQRAGDRKTDEASLRLVRS